MDELLEQLIDQCRPYASEGRLASYIPEDEEEAMLIVEKTIPRLQHVNSAVMLG